MSGVGGPPIAQAYHSPPQARSGHAVRNRASRLTCFGADGEQHQLGRLRLPSRHAAETQVSVDTDGP